MNLIDKSEVMVRLAGCIEEPLASMVQLIMESVDRLPAIEVKPVSPYTRPKYRKGIGWTLYGRPVRLFYSPEGGRATGEA